MLHVNSPKTSTQIHVAASDSSTHQLENAQADLARVSNLCRGVKLSKLSARLVKQPDGSKRIVLREKSRSLLAGLQKLNPRRWIRQEITARQAIAGVIDRAGGQKDGTSRRRLADDCLSALHDPAVDRATFLEKLQALQSFREPPPSSQPLAQAVIPVQLPTPCNISATANGAGLQVIFSRSSLEAAPLRESLPNVPTPRLRSQFGLNNSALFTLGQKLQSLRPDVVDQRFEALDELIAILEGVSAVEVPASEAVASVQSLDEIIAELDDLGSAKVPPLEAAASAESLDHLIGELTARAPRQLTA